MWGAVERGLISIAFFWIPSLDNIGTWLVEYFDQTPIGKTAKHLRGGTIQQVDPHQLTPLSLHFSYTLWYFLQLTLILFFLFLFISSLSSSLLFLSISNTPLYSFSISCPYWLHIQYSLSLTFLYFPPDAPPFLPTLISLLTLSSSDVPYSSFYLYPISFFSNSSQITITFLLLEFVHFF